MIGPKSGSQSARPRPGGGFNQGMGGFGEHLDEQAMQQAMQQKQLGQQQVANQQQSLAQGQGGGKAAQDFTKNEALQQQLAQGKQGGTGTQQPTRQVGSLREELLERPAKDIVKGLASLFDIRSVLGINPQTDSPEDQAKKRQMLQRFNQLTEEEQQVAQQRYQEEMQKKQHEEEEKERKKQEVAQAESEAIQAPSGPQKGPQGPGGSKKQKAVTKLQSDRQKLSGPSSAG